MDRAVRLVLFVFGIFIGSVFMIVGTKVMEARVQGHEGHEALTGLAGAEEFDDEELAARSHGYATRRAEAIAAAAAAEAVDPDWGPAAERSIIGRFAASAPVGFKLLSTTCKTSICVTEVETPSLVVSTKESGWHRFLGVSSGYVYHRGDEDGAARSVVFSARDGHSLPVIKNMNDE